MQAERDPSSNAAVSGKVIASRGSPALVKPKPTLTTIDIAPALNLGASKGS